MDDLKTGGSSSISEIELSKIQPNPEQPRSIFEEETLEELATSIRSLGVIQPITLKEIGPEQYMIISGERRYRASLKAGLERIPAYIKTAADENVVEMALIENIQREDLNSIEIALAYQKLIDNYGLTQEGLSERVGKKRATIANYLRLLKLPAEIQVGLKDKKIDMGHARALIPVDDPEVQLALYEQILAQGLSVRNVEEMVRNIAEGIQPELPEKKKSDRKPILPEEFKLLKDHLSRYFNTKVQLTCNEKGKGKYTAMTDTAIYIIKGEATKAQRAWAENRYQLFDRNDVYNADGSTKNMKQYLELSKFADPTRASKDEDRSTRDGFMIRIAEMYLIAAEAGAKANKADALDYMNKLRMTRAISGYEDAMRVELSQIQDIDFILDERGTGVGWRAVALV